MLKVGFIGPLWIEEIIKECFSMFPSILVEYRFSDNIYDAIHFTVELNESVDCFLYSSRATYLLVKDHVELLNECYYIPLKGNGIYRALYKLTRNSSIKWISIDGLAEEYIESVMKNIEDIKFINVDRSSDIQHAEEIYEHHVKAHRHYEGLGVISSLKIVADALQEAAIPAVWLKPTKEDIIVCLERMMLATSKRREWENQVVFGKMQLNIMPGNPSTNKEKSYKKYKTEKIISSFVDEMNGFLLPNNEHEYVFITHRGEFERVTEGYKVLNLYNEILKIHGCSLQIGIGFGWTIQLANYHGDLALIQAKQFTNNSAFIVNEQRIVIGPIEIDTPMTYKLDNENISNKLKQNEIMKAYLRKNRLTFFTANEVAATLNVTNRTANRIISNWIDLDYIQFAGIEKVTRKGRPRQRYVFMEELK